MKPKKNKCDKHCECGKKCVCKTAVEDTTVNSLLKEVLEDGRKKVMEYSDVACKVGEVLKFMLGMVRSAKSSYEDLARMLERNGGKLDGVKVDLSGDVAKLGVDVTDGKFDPAEEMFKALVAKSKFDFSGFDVAGARAPSKDKGDCLAFNVQISKSTDQGSGITQVDTEGTTFFAYPDMDKSIKEFDRTIDGFIVCKPPLKKVSPPKCEKSCAKPITVKPPVKPKKCSKRIVPVIADLKKTVLECSEYAVPPSRVKFVYDHEDKKHRNHVYEVRFFQNSYKSVPAETQSYERAELNVRSRGDRDDLIAKRFDKIVDGLKFNSFPKKK